MQQPLDVDPIFREQFERREKRRALFKFHRRFFLAVTIPAFLLMGCSRLVSYGGYDGGIAEVLAPAAGVLLIWAAVLALHALDVYVVLDRLDRRRTRAKYDKLKREFDREMAAANEAGSALEEKAKAKPKRGMVTIGDDGELVYPEEIEQADTGATSGVDQQQDQARSGA